MPKVGGKKFGYGPAGMKAARKAAKKTGKRMVASAAAGAAAGIRGAAARTKKRVTAARTQATRKRNVRAAAVRKKMGRRG